MKTKWTMRWSLMALAVLLVSAVWAQPPGRPGGMRDNPKREVSRIIAGIGHLEKSGKAKLSTAQARKILDIVSPWRKRSTMNEAQAKDLNKKLRAVLTSTQTKELESWRPGRRDGQRGEQRRGGPGRGEGKRGEGRGGNRREGSRGPGGDWRKDMEKAEAFYKNHNPLASPSSNPAYKQMPSRMQEGMKRRYEATNAVLVALAKKAGRR